MNEASFTVDVSADDALKFAELSGDWNPLHTDPKYASKTTYKKPKPIACERCGRTNHTADRCYATTDVEGYEINSDESEEEFYESDSGEENSYNIVCYRCGRPGHTKPNCYAETHTKGYQLYY